MIELGQPVSFSSSEAPASSEDSTKPRRSRDKRSFGGLEFIALDDLVLQEPLLLLTSATLVVTGALLVVTRFRLDTADTHQMR